MLTTWQTSQTILILEDFISFGRTVPEDSKKYGKTVCMAGYSPEFRRMFRIYPWPTHFKVRCRSMIRVWLERNKMDSRQESWSIKHRDPNKSVALVREPIGKNELREYLDGNVNHSIHQLNKERRSLGILRVTWSVPEIKNGKPYLRFVDDEVTRCLQVRDWGLHILMSKYERDGRLFHPNTIPQSLHMVGQRDSYFIVGNMCHRRNVWLIIKVFTFPTEEPLKLEDLS